MTDFISVFNFSLSITLPIFFIIFLGLILNKLRVINDNFIDVSSKLVFNITLPALLFISILKTDLSSSVNFSLVLFGVIAVFVTYLLFEIMARYLVTSKQDRGVVVQGAFRSNMGIIGLAYCVNAYGDAVFAVVSLYLAGVTILFNILSVVTLNHSLNKDVNLLNTIKSIGKNPLILSILAALLVSSAAIKLPETLIKTGTYFAQMTLPLALLCAGATLNFQAIKKGMNLSILASVGKLIIIPFILTFSAFLFGFRGIELGVIFLMSSAPTASVSYIVVRSMGGNSGLAANIIVLTTLMSLFSTSIGVTFLRSFSLI
ncbi:AEC family transporter [Marinomonas agarivorans]|nr:AEC family transporter [Marinomonas agarivorans]